MNTHLERATLLMKVDILCLQYGMPFRISVTRPFGTMNIEQLPTVALRAILHQFDPGPGDSI